MKLAFVFCVICLVSADPPAPALDGKSLAGWDFLTEYWKVEDGKIVGHHDGSLKENTFLCSQKKFKDFELECKVKLTGKTANSGIQIRSEVDDPKGWVVKGPQCDMGDKYWGSLYGEKFGGMMQQSDFDKVKTKLKPNDWNDYFVKVVGKKVTIAVNGITTVDKAFENLPPEGIIALQIHKGQAMSAEFKDIKWREFK